MSSSTISVDARHDLKGRLDVLRQCLTNPRRPLGFFLGAGCPFSIKIPKEGKEERLIPDICGLTEKVCEMLQSCATVQPVMAALRACCKADKAHTSAEPTIEDFLNLLRNICAVGGPDAVRGIKPDEAQQTDEAICVAIAGLVKRDLPDNATPYHALARWIRGTDRMVPVEIFTPNYDLLCEQALEEHGVPYFDGFVGSRHAFLDIQAMERYPEPPDKDSLPARWARVWKLHGSVNWHRKMDGDRIVAVWRSNSDENSGLLISPSHHKYSESRQMPFLAMLDRLKAFLGRTGAVLVVCGYAFADEHFNATIREGLRGNPSAVVFALSHGPLSSAHPLAKTLAGEAPNFFLLAENAGIIGGSQGDWACGADGTSNECKLGDFVALGKFLSSIDGSAENGSPHAS